MDKYDDYLDRHPLHEEIVEFYNKEVGKHLNKLRKEANQIRFDQELNPKERTAQLKENKEEQNIIKYDMIQQFKEYGLKP
jgi:aconitase A